MALRFMCENFAVKDGGNVGKRVGKGYAKTYKEYAESKFYLVGDMVIYTPTIWFYFLLLLVLVYLVVTVRYSVTLLKSPVLPKRLRYLHLVLIWAIPFVWIMLLRILTGPTPGSYGIDRNKDEKPFFDVFRNLGE